RLVLWIVRVLVLRIVLILSLNRGLRIALVVLCDGRGRERHQYQCSAQDELFRSVDSHVSSQLRSIGVPGHRRISTAAIGPDDRNVLYLDEARTGAVGSKVAPQMIEGQGFASAEILEFRDRQKRYLQS